ncbi:MAG: flagellin lysine-N-methylase [Terriglobales bacterium]
MLDHLRPHYAKSFRCLGSQCEDNCCRAWEVAIDRATYQRYERIPALQPRLQDCFSLITEGASDGRHAVIKLTSSFTCPFLSADKLCSLQQRYGDSYLSEACASYPRNPHRVDGLMEQPLSLSCIEAARLVLLNPQLRPRDEPGHSAYSRFLVMPNEAVPQSGNQFRYFWDVRELCLLLVEDRSYALWQRLFLLGMFCKRLGEMVGARQFGFVPKLLRAYAEIASSGNLRSAMDGIPVRATAQVQMVVQVAFGYLRQHKPELCRIHDCLQDFLQGVGYHSDSGLESCTREYAEAYARYYQPFMEEHPFLLENYLINHIFRVVFPFGQVPDKSFERPQQEYLLMCLEFAVLKGLLIGMAGHYRESFSAEHVVRLAQSLAKSLEHDPTIGGAINWQGLSDANCVAALLRN